jgi:hypothetical protein
MSSKIFNLKNLIWFCAIGLAAFSGYYSVFGISKLFAGGSWSIIGMAAMLEFSKLVVVTFLHDHFKTLKLAFKAYLLSSAIVLMAITSIGVYGYLTNSYQETAKVIYKTQNEITLLDQKKKLFEDQKIQIDKAVEEKINRLKSLDQVRVSQQNAYTEQLSKNKGTWSLSKNISSIDKSSETINNDISTLTQKSFALSDSIAAIEQTKLTLNNETFSSELGPLLYLSRITGVPMDVVVNWFILILVVVFDPLAVSLVVAANHLKHKEKQQQTLDELSQVGQEIETDPPLEEPDFFQDEVLEVHQDEIQDVHDSDVVTIRTKDVDNEPVSIQDDNVQTPELQDDQGDVSTTKLKPVRSKRKRLKKTGISSILQNSSIVDEQKEFYQENDLGSVPEEAHRPAYERYKRGISV